MLNGLVPVIIYLQPRTSHIAVSNSKEVEKLKQKYKQKELYHISE